MNEEVKSYRKDGKIIIELPENNLIFAAENNLEFGCKIIDKEKFLNSFSDNILESTDTYNEDVLFFKFLEQVMYQMASEGENIEFKE